jgi:hypothetical protein
LTSPQGPITDRPARAVFALLVLACFGAFFITQRLKHTPTAVQLFKLTPRFSPTMAGHVKEEQISFRLARSDAVTVTIIDSSGGEVATLVRDHQTKGYKVLSLRWNGRGGVAHRYSTRTATDGRPILVPDNRGRPAPAGEYRVRVSLREQRRSVESPRSFTLVRP